MTDTVYEVGTAEVVLDEEFPVEIDLFDYCVSPWRPNDDVELTEIVRPTLSSGFALQCTTAGTTGQREPVWPKTLSATATDGSVTWTVIAAGTNGVNAASSPTASVTPSTGLTVSGVSISESRKLLATYEGDTEGEYVVTYTFTVGGKARKVRQAVTVT